MDHWLPPGYMGVQEARSLAGREELDLLFPAPSWFLASLSDDYLGHVRPRGLLYHGLSATEERKKGRGGRED